MQKQRASQYKKIFLTVSWIFLVVVFAALIVYLSVHVVDLLDSDMSSEMVLAKELARSGKLFTDAWHYSTEIRVINTQLFYGVFFLFLNDWQLVRILGTVLLYLALLGSYYFFCKKLRIELFFPVTAAIMLLPLSSPYFYIFLYGAYYIPRISMMFLLLGVLISTGKETASNFSRLLNYFLVSAIPLVLGLEGPRMILILFIPLAVLVGLEGLMFFLREKAPLTERIDSFKHSEFIPFFAQSFIACFFSLVGYVINATVLSKIYTFEHTTLKLQLSLSNIRSTIYNQIHSIGFNDGTFFLSLVIWAVVGVLCLIYLFSKRQKTIESKRFILFSLIAWACYSLFSCLFPIGLVSWHFVPVAILFIPCFVLVVMDLKLKPVLRNVAFAVVGLCVLFTAVQGYSSFEDWYIRKDVRTNQEFSSIASVLETEQFDSGYATFWNANILTELTDGKIDMWSLNEFSGNTAKNPDVFHWLQLSAHDNTLAQGKTFVIWSAEEYKLYGEQSFDYIGREIYRSDAFVVFEVINH